MEIMKWVDEIKGVRYQGHRGWKAFECTLSLIKT